MNLLSFKNHIRVLALFLMCLFAPMAFAQQPPQPCHITITGDFESQCILPRDKEDYINEEPESLIRSALQLNMAGTFFWTAEKKSYWWAGKMPVK